MSEAPSLCPRKTAKHISHEHLSAEKIVLWLHPPIHNFLISSSQITLDERGGPMEILLKTLIVAIFTVLWETVIRHPVFALISIIKRKRSRKRLFNFQGDLYITKSILPLAPRPATRESDNQVEKAIERILQGKIAVQQGTPNLDLSNPYANLIIIGSTKYNKYAALLQQCYSTQFEYVFDIYEGEPAKEVLKIINQYGDEYVSSTDLENRNGDVAIDYGILFYAILKNGKRLIWISGIHGAGTLGVYKFLIENPSLLLNQQSQQSAKSWLLRIKHDREFEKETIEIVRGYELIGSADNCCPRDTHKKPKALICDFGNVIMLFDRSRTYRAIAHWLKIPLTEVQKQFEVKKDLRLRYERGEFENDEQFYEAIMELFGNPPEMTFALFSEFWGDIFWPNSRIIKVLESLKNQLVLVLLSNTNSLHINDVIEHYSDIVALFNDRLVLSYKEKLAKPDKKIFKKAIEVAGPDISPDQCVYVDDKAEYVNVANEMGMRGVVFFSYTQFVYQLRRMGLYIDVRFEGQEEIWANAQE
jgi:glucose-1-phosphatase